MNALLLVTTGLLLGCAAGCATAAESPGPLAMRSLTKGGFSGIQEAKQEVVKDQEAWEKLWTQHTKTAKPPPRLPAVDFHKEMVIVATIGTKRTGGYAIEVVSVEVASNKLKVSIKQSSPPPGAMTIQALTAPFHFVAVPRSDLKPEFVEAKRPAAR